MYVKIAKIREVRTPVRANPGDAGIDFFVPDEFGERVLKHGESVLIPAGIKVEVPFGYALIFHNKSGVAAKKDLYVGADTIDHAYQGEVHINLINNGESDQVIHAGDKIIQGILIPVILANPMLVNEDELYRDVYVAGSRGTGGFGSTGTK
jgi:dUTP pyrophosphatase